MYLTINISDFDIKYIYYHKKINNIIIKNSDFIRLCYSNNSINLNGIYLNFKLNNINLFNTICNIEDNILNSIKINNYTKYYSLNKKIKNLVNNNDIKIIYNISHNKLNNNQIINNVQNNVYNNDYILKISGIWLNDFKYGLIFKIYRIINI